MMKTETHITVEKNEGMEPLARIDEVARLLNLSLPAIRHYIRQKKIPFLKIGGSIRFDLNEVGAWINDKAVGPDIKPALRKVRKPCKN